MIQIIETKLGQSVKMTELYDYLELSKNYYSRFIAKEIENNPYCVDNVDCYTPVQVTSESGRYRQEYFVHIDFAKKICMLSKTKKGEEIRNELVKLTKQKENLDLLTHEQVLFLTALKTFYKYVENQTEIKNEHQKKYVSEHPNKFNRFAEFNIWRNKMLDIEPKTLNKMVIDFTVKNQKQINKSISKDRIINLLDSYDGLKNAVWDCLNVRGEINALKIAELVKNMAKVENLAIFKTNETDLFRTKENIQNPKMLKM